MRYQMNLDASLKENVKHGTNENPISGIHFFVGEGSSFPDHFFVERHWHHTIEIIYIVRGTYLFEINLEEYVLKEGDLCFLNGEELHQITGEGRGTIHDVLLFDPKILEFTYPDEMEEQVIAPLIRHEKILPSVMRSHEPYYEEVLSIIRRLIDKSLKKQSGWYFSCKLGLLELVTFLSDRGLLLPAASSLSESDRQKIDRYKKLVSYMEKHYAEPVSLKELSEAVSCNPQYLCRFFKEITGTTPIQYLISIRLSHACTLLRESTKSILEISLDCGFENTSYFIRKFRQQNGCTPREYRVTVRS